MLTVPVVLNPAHAEPLVRKVQRIINPDGFGQAVYVAWIEDCFDPPIYLVFADTAEEACETFYNDEKIAQHLSVADCLADYKGPEDEQYSCDFNDEGVPVDLEAVHISPTTWDAILECSGVE